MGALKFEEKDQERLKEAGVAFVKYGREHSWDVKANINHRTHRKILVVDGKVGFTGGMCIDDRWLGDADLSNLALPHFDGHQLMVFLLPGLPDKDGNLVAGEFPAEFGFTGGNGRVALVGALGEARQQFAGNAGKFKAMLAAFDGVAELLHFAGQGVAVDLRQVARPFKDVRSFEGEKPGV